MQSIAEILARELGLNQKYVENVVQLIDEGNTIPFIARYRKEMHGAMDDTTLRNLETRLTYLRSLQQRRDEVKKSIENQGKLTEELSAAIDSAATMTEVEDLYRPYKQKRRTRGSVAREKGLDPLAQAIFAQDGQDIEKLALTFVDEEKGVTSREEAIACAEQSLLHTYNRYQIILEKGEGMYLFDSEGKKYFDFCAGIAVFALGYKNERLNQAVKDQVDQLVSGIDRPLKLAVMGCVVNGPGEAREADLGIAGGKGEGLIFRKGEIIRKVAEENLLSAFQEELDKLLQEQS